MKKTIITLASVAALAVSANAQTYIAWQNLTDNNGGAFGDTNGQTFDLGNGAIATITWSGDFISATNSPTAATNISNQQDTGTATVPVSNSITIAINGVSADWDVRSQSGSTGAVRESGTLVANGAWTIDSSTVDPLTGAGTNTLSYDGATTDATSGQFFANFSGTSLTYNYTSGHVTSNDIFAVAISGFVIPEPSSTALLGLGALGLLARRKR